MSDSTTFDIVIIGAGPGGYCAAIRAAQMGFSTAVIEKSPSMGGTCLNVGCIPSKALLDSSDHFLLARSGLSRHGVITDAVRLDLGAMMARKAQIVATLTRGVESLLRGNRVTILQGTARFVSPHDIAIDSEGAQKRCTASRAVIIASGSIPATLPIAPVDGQTIVDSTGALSFGRVPPRLAVIGGGAIGVELASVWMRLGSQVTIVEQMPQLLPGWDPQVAATLTRCLSSQGARILTGTTLAGVEKTKNGVVFTLSGQDGHGAIEADAALVAIGRKPNTAGLDLDKIGISPDPRGGRLRVDKAYKTECDGVYAIGDVIAGPMLAHKAFAEGAAAVECIAGKAGSVNYDALPSVVYTSPEAAFVGTSEENLKVRKTPYSTGTFFFKANGRALAMDRAEGFVKILSDSASDRVLGVHIVGPGASELIGQAVAIIEFGGSAEDMARMAQAHPTLSEVLKEAALDVENIAIHASPKGKNTSTR